MPYRETGNYQSTWRGEGEGAGGRGQGAGGREQGEGAGGGGGGRGQGGGGGGRGQSTQLKRLSKNWVLTNSPATLTPLYVLI